MPRKTLVYWKSLRPFAFGGSLLPLALGSFTAMGEGAFSLTRFVLSLLGVWFIHAAGNLTNDYYDFHNNLDSLKTRGRNNPLVTRALTPSYYRKMISVFFLSSVIIGIILWNHSGIWFPLLGFTGIFFAFFYTAPPLSLKYRGWGTLIVFFIFGPLLTGGGFLVQTGYVAFMPFLLGIFPGFLMTAVLLTNELMDYNSDKEKQIITTAIKLGRRNSRKVLLILLGLPFFLLIAFVLFEILPLRVLIVLLTIPGVINLLVKIKQGITIESQLDIKAAKFHILFTAVLTISLFLL